MIVMVFAPHPDDEILGCGGTIARHIAAGDEVTVCICTRSMNDEAHRINTELAAASHACLGVKKTFFLPFPTVELPHTGIREFNGEINKAVQETRPEIVYIPFYGDMHADHAATANAAMVALRPVTAPFVRSVYAYETLSETGWNYPTADKAFMPNVFVDISQFIETKIEAMRKYSTKLMRDPHPRSEEGIRALAKYRGCTANREFAEAFMCMRSII